VERGVMGANDMTPEQFAGRVRQCREGLTTPEEVVASFFEGVGEHPSQIPAFYRLLPADLAGTLAEKASVSAEAWIEWATKPPVIIDGHGLGGFCLGFSGVHQMLPASVTAIE